MRKRRRRIVHVKIKGMMRRKKWRAGARVPGGPGTVPPASC